MQKSSFFEHNFLRLLRLENSYKASVSDLQYFDYSRQGHRERARARERERDWRRAGMIKKREANERKRDREREMLGMDEWIWQYPELHPNQPRVTRLNHTEEIYSLRVAVKD